MDLMSTTLLTALAVLAAGLLLAGCISVGRGSATLIPAKLDKQATGFQKYFPDLVSSSEEMRELTPGATRDRKKYLEYFANKLGCTDCKTSDLSIVVRDRTKIPPFLPVDINLEKELLGLYLNKELSNEQKEQLASIAAGNILNVPDLPSRTTIHDVIPGKERRYFYYPRLQIDLLPGFVPPRNLTD